MTDLFSIGLGNYINTTHLIAIVSPESAPVKRLVQDAKDKGVAIDATYGRRTRAVLVMDSGQVILSSSQPSTLAGKNTKNKLMEDELV